MNGSIGELALKSFIFRPSFGKAEKKSQMLTKYRYLTIGFFYLSVLLSNSFNFNLGIS